jgi:hypothetical protein
MSITSYVPKKFTWLALTITLFGSAFIFVSRGLSGDLLPRAIVNPEGVVRPEPAAEQRRALIESEIITATRRGFEPMVISRPEGKFILMIDNRSGKDLTFHLARETGERLNEIASSRHELDWNEVLDLQPGKYILTEQDHPEWACSIRITAK